MVRYKLMALLFLLCTMACNDAGKTSAATNRDTSYRDSAAAGQPADADTVLSGCYSQLSGRDTASFQVQHTKGIISGTLSYNIYEKDRNSGSFQGELVADTLRGWYLFKSEGVMSVREIAWKVNGTELWQGTGEMVERNDTLRFATGAKLKFDKDRPFKKVPCVL